jgi:hypothetical protein
MTDSLAEITQISGGAPAFLEAVLDRDERQELLESALETLNQFSREELKPKHRTILRRFVFTEAQRAAMVQAASKASAKRYASDPEYRARHNAATNAAITLRYATDEAFREKKKAGRRERYARQKATRAVTLEDSAELPHEIS